MLPSRRQPRRATRRMRIRSARATSVVYPAHGVGRIDRVGFEEIAGHRLHLIHISFDENQMTLRVPVAQARAAGLRKLAGQKELADGAGHPEWPAAGEPADVGQARAGIPGEDQLGRTWRAGRGGSGSAGRRRRFRQQLQPAQSVRTGARPPRRRVRRHQPNRQGGSGRPAHRRPCSRQERAAAARSIVGRHASVRDPGNISGKAVPGPHMPRTALFSVG